MSERAKCRSCQAPVIFLESAVSRALLVLDAEPVPDGNIAIVDGKAKVKGNTLFDEMLPGPFYKDHHATCPHAAEWRRKKK